MRKNIAIFVLGLALSAITYKYIILNGKFNIQQLESNNKIAVSTHSLKFEEGGENSYVVTSEDKAFWMLFVYDKQGLKLFGLRDGLSGKEINFNFSTEGELCAYSYEDEQYGVMTNVASVYPEKILDRLERYKGFEVIYELLPDGIAKVTQRTYADE
jgi:hypothetical protein